MAYNATSKIKILYLLKILQEETDAAHGLTMSQILQKLQDYGISAERKSIYADIKTLREFDIDVKLYRRNPPEYAIERRDFSLSELMLMVDAVQSCKAITEKQAQRLICNIKQLATNREQDLLDRSIHVVGRVKSKTDSVLKVVDEIHKALKLRCKMDFLYRRIGPDGKQYLTRKGKAHVISPIEIAYEDGFYYVSAWDECYKRITEYRLDRMTDIKILEDVPATKNKEIARWRYDDDKAVRFGRFAGDEVTATLRVAPDKVEIITDRFGKDAVFIGADKTEALVRVRVCKSQQFFGWVAGMGKAIQITAPKSLVDEYRSYLRFLLED